MSIFGPGAVTIAGHKISYGLLAAGAGIAGAVLLVIQMRSQGGSIGSGTSSAGTYTDQYGNVYDANGNLIAAAPIQTDFSGIAAPVAGPSSPTTSAPSVSLPAPTAARSLGYTATAVAAYSPHLAAVPKTPVPAHTVNKAADPRYSLGYKAAVYPVQKTTFPATESFTVPGPTKIVPTRLGNVAVPTKKKITLAADATIQTSFNPLRGRSSGTQAIA